MDDRVRKLIKPMIFIAAVAFGICCLIRRPTAIADYASYVGYAVTFVTILFVLYEKYFWRKIPWNRPPMLKEKYDGKIIYDYNEQKSEKPITISVKQSWLMVEVKTSTDINSSYSVTGSIVHEHGADFLFYTYVTEPLAADQPNNPIQYGTCKMALNSDNSKLHGTYWTTSRTTGDVEWTAQRQ